MVVADYVQQYGFEDDPQRSKEDGSCFGVIASEISWRLLAIHRVVFLSAEKDAGV